MDLERITIDGAVLLIAPIGDREMYGPYLTESDEAYLSTVSSPERKASGAAWRAALRCELGGVGIKYGETGAPEVYDTPEKIYIGVSHSAGFAVVMVSPVKCAVDIERADRDFSKAAKRYISKEEYSLPGSEHRLFMGLMWCAKEAIYKYSGLKGLGLIEDIKITSLNIVSGDISGKYRTTNGIWAECKLKLLCYSDLLIVYAS